MDNSASQKWSLITMVAKMTLVTCIGFMFYQFTVDDKVREGIRTRLKRILVAKVKSFNFLQEQQRFSMFPGGLCGGLNSRPPKDLPRPNPRNL